MRTIFILMITAGLLSGCASKKRAFITGGINYSTLTGDDADSFDGKVGVNAGAGLNFNLCESWNLEPGLQFSSQGADYSDSDFEGTFKLNYLNLPIMAQYEVTDGLHLEAGPQFGLLLSAKDEFTFDGETGEEDVKDDAKNLDFGLNFGAGYTFDNGIFLRARYNLGLTDVIDNAELSASGAKWKNGVVQLSLGYYIKLGDIKGESKDD